MLDEEPETEPNHNVNARADTKVQNWATAVSASLHDGTPTPEEQPEDHAMDETRTAHFDRPLKEVRVGESPSRPWGISIPAKYTNAESSSSVGSVPTASPQFPLDTGRPVEDTPQSTGKCPFDHRAMMNQAHEQHQSAQAVPPPSSPPGVANTQAPPAEPLPQRQPPVQNGETGGQRLIPQMIFNGPVFLGYPPDQLALLLQNSNLGATMR